MELKKERHVDRVRAGPAVTSLEGRGRQQASSRPGVDVTRWQKNDFSTVPRPFRRRRFMVPQTLALCHRKQPAFLQRHGGSQSARNSEGVKDQSGERPFSGG